MNSDFKVKLYSFTIDCINPQELAKFYADLLSWETKSFDETWAYVYAPGTVQGSYPSLLFQRNPNYKAPVWPEEPEAQQQMAHLDFAVNDLDKAVQHAILCGATIAEQQFSNDWRVMFDPSGHPFCLCQMKSLMESDQFGLL